MSARRGPFVGLHGPDGTLIQFWPFDPNPEDIHIASIAKSLGKESRFCGQTEGFWPVASHCVEASYVQNEDGSKPTDEEAFERLMHDASEGLGLRDLPAPLKRNPEMGMAAYQVAEYRVMSAVAVRYDMAYEFWDEPRVKYADAILYRTEVRDFRQPGTWDDPTLIGPTLPHRLQPTTPEDAERQFLERFVALCAKTGRTDATEEGMRALEQLTPSGVDIEVSAETAANAFARWFYPRSVVSKTSNFGV